MSGPSSSAAAAAWLELHEFGAAERELASLCLRLDSSASAAWCGVVAACLLAARRGGHTVLSLDAAVPLATGEFVAWPREVLDLDPADAPLMGTAEDRSLIIVTGRSVALLADHELESEVAAGFALRMRDRRPMPNAERVGSILRKLFKEPEGDAARQAMAAVAALHHPFLCLTGGPGTGKTTTVVRLIALLLEFEPDTAVALAAPTGKAAARLSQSISRARENLPIPKDQRGRIPATVKTLHSLLGRRPGVPGARHDQTRLLPYDLIVVDEASMIDLATMASLLAALPERCRLVLVGDPEQLPSVAPGRIMSDLVESCPDRVAQEVAACWRAGVGPDLNWETTPDSPTNGTLVRLTKAWRFASGGAIGRLATALQTADAAAFIEHLSAEEPPRLQASAPRHDQLIARWREHRDAIAAAPSAEQALALAAEFQVLCATRVGPHGVDALNALAEAELGARPGDGVRSGCPVIIRRNDAHAQLANGDMGIVWRNPESSDPPLVWVGAEGGRPRAFAPGDLPEHDPAWALTVHQSQGSEFTNVWIILPDATARGISRSLLYTGVTRARKGAWVFGEHSVVRQAMTTEQPRQSGLGGALRNALGGE